MAFKQWDINHIAKFNSAASSDLLDKYISYVESKIKSKAEEPSHKTFSGSSFRCNRRSWFRLRGTEPDHVAVPDRTLNFTAEIGTACHRIIQNNLKTLLGDDWLSAKSYVESLYFDSDFLYEVKEDADGLEAQIHIYNPPIMFACDGLIRLNGKIYLLEIKTSEFSSWNDLTDPKPQHIDQIKCYASLLNIHDVLFLYQDRQYGDFKCYEIHVSDADMKQVKDRFDYVMDMVDKNLAPEPLPKGDPWCTVNMCPYYKKCQEYGRY